MPDEEKISRALFAEGAGAQGAYSHCSWECLGIGQLYPATYQTHTLVHWYDRRLMSGGSVLVPEIVLERVKNVLYDVHPYESLRLI